MTTEPGPSDPTSPQQDVPQSGGAEAWGRVDADLTVYVRTPEGERAVGQYPEGTPEEALAFYAKRFEALDTEVSLLEQRVRAGALGPDDARKSVERVRADVVGANAVGDLTSLVGRLDALAPVIAVHQKARREERARRTEEARVRKQQIVDEAESLAAGHDWRSGGNRLRDLLEEWKALPRLDRASDDELWHRFSSARTSYTRGRKAHYSELEGRQGAAKAEKVRLVKEAEALSSSTEWGVTSGKYRDLMARWKAAGPAARGDDDKLWKQFRAAQDVFFSARDAANSAQDEEFAANAVVKEQILAEAEAILPVTDLEDAKRRLRDLADRWEAAGKVPRARIKELESRMRKVEQAVRAVEDDQWKRSDPEKSARADDMVAQLESAIAALEAKLATARASGDTKAVSRLTDELDGRRQFLEMAKKVSADYS